LASPNLSSSFALKSQTGFSDKLKPKRLGQHPDQKRTLPSFSCRVRFGPGVAQKTFRILF
jgi:hypothetical protein